MGRWYRGVFRAFHFRSPAPVSEAGRRLAVETRTGSGKFSQVRICYPEEFLMARFSLLEGRSPTSLRLNALVTLRFYCTYDI